jgi:hypothetical protein
MQSDRFFHHWYLVDTGRFFSFFVDDVPQGALVVHGGLFDRLLLPVLVLLETFHDPMENIGAYIGIEHVVVGIPQPKLHFDMGRIFVFVKQGFYQIEYRIHY